MEGEGTKWKGGNGMNGRVWDWVWRGAWAGRRLLPTSTAGQPARLSPIKGGASQLNTSLLPAPSPPRCVCLALLPCRTAPIPTPSPSPARNNREETGGAPCSEVIEGSGKKWAAFASSRLPPSSPSPLPPASYAPFRPPEFRWENEGV